MATPMKSRASETSPLPDLGFPRFCLCCGNRKGSPAKSQIPQTHDPK